MEKFYSVEWNGSIYRWDLIKNSKDKGKWYHRTSLMKRNEDGCLLLHSEKPSKEYDDLTRMWYWSSAGNSMELDDQIYPEVTFENGPREVELKLTKE